MGPLSPSLAAFIEDIRTRWGVPAISVSLVTGQSQGFGSPSSGPMTPDTVTAIASNTKLITCVAIGILVEQGKLTFDTKIKDLIPGFKLENEHTTEFVTIADALSHSTGCASCNMTYAYRTNDSSKDVLDNVCASRCHTQLLKSFAYDNRWFSVAMYIIEHLSGQAYSEFIKAHILIPLKMSHSTFSSKEAEPNAATPSMTLDDGKTVQELPFWHHKVQPGNAWEGAAGLFSTSSDLVKWLSYLMRTIRGENQPDDPRIISLKTLKEILRPRNITSLQMWFTNLERGEVAHPEFSTPLYGLGVERYHLHGIDVASHNGCITGYSSVTLWTPNRDFGVVVLANQDHRGNSLINIIALRAFEEHFGIKHVDWEARTLARRDMWATGPAKLPKMIHYDNPVVKASEIRGTYSAKGYQDLHVIGLEDQEGIPTRVLELREHFLHSKAKVFGKFAGEIRMIAIWDSTEMLESDFAILYHVGENVYHAEWVLMFEAYHEFEAILAPASAIWNSSGSLLYAYTDADGKQNLEFKQSWTAEVPKVALGEGDFTFTRVQTF